MFNECEFSNTQITDKYHNYKDSDKLIKRLFSKMLQNTP